MMASELPLLELPHEATKLEFVTKNCPKTGDSMKTAQKFEWVS